MPFADLGRDQGNERNNGGPISLRLIEFVYSTAGNVFETWGKPRVRLVSAFPLAKPCMRTNCRNAVSTVFGVVTIVCMGLLGPKRRRATLDVTVEEGSLEFRCHDRGL